MSNTLSPKQMDVVEALAEADTQAAIAQRFKASHAAAVECVMAPPAHKSSIILSVDMTVGASASQVTLIKVENSMGDNITDQFRAFSNSIGADLTKKEKLESAASKFAKQFGDSGLLP